MEKGFLQNVFKKAAIALVAVAFLTLGGAVSVPWMEVVQLHAAPATNGICGKDGNQDVTWYYNDHTLTIGGTKDFGRMQDYEDSAEVPWDHFREEITTIKISGFVTYVGKNAFGGCTNLKEIVCDPDSKYLSVIDNVLYAKANNAPTALVFCPLSKTGSITVPGTVKGFADNSFCAVYNKDNIYSKLSEIRFAARPEKESTISSYSSGYFFHAFGDADAEYTGNCIIYAPDGKRIRDDWSITGGNTSLKVEDIIKNDSPTLWIVDPTRWDELENMVIKGGLVTLTADYDYTQDSYLHNVYRLDEKGEWVIKNVYYSDLDIPAGTTIDLNGHTIKGGLRAFGDVTIKNGNLECNLFSESSEIDDKTVEFKDGPVKVTLENVRAKAILTDEAEDYASGALGLYGGLELKNTSLTVTPTVSVWFMDSAKNSLIMDDSSEIIISQKDLAEFASQYPDAPKRASLSMFYYGNDSENELLKNVDKYNEAFAEYLPSGFHVKGTDVLTDEKENFHELYFSFADKTGSIPETVTLRSRPEDFVIRLSQYSYVYDGKQHKPTVTVTYKGQELGTRDYRVKWYGDRTKVGSYRVEVLGKTKALKPVKGETSFEITLAENPMKVEPKFATIKLKKATKTKPKQEVTDKKYKFSISSKVVKVTKKKGKLSYAIDDPYVSVNNKTKQITVKPGLPEGDYKYKVKVKAAGDKNHKEKIVEVDTFIRVKY